MRNGPFFYLIEYQVISETKLFTRQSEIFLQELLTFLLFRGVVIGRYGTLPRPIISISGCWQKGISLNEIELEENGRNYRIIFARRPRQNEER